MAIGEIKQHNGKKYITVGPVSGCSGCAFYSTDGGCDAFNSGMDDNCYNDQSIWKECKDDNSDKYTVEEVIDCLINANWIAKTSKTEAIESVNKRIKLMTDPDYQIFLQLKEKFKDIE